MKKMKTAVISGRLEGCCGITKRKLEGPKSNLSMHVKDNKSIPANTSAANQGRAKENLCIFLDMAETWRKRMRKRLRYLIPSLPQSLTVRPAVTKVPSLLSRKTEMRSKCSLHNAWGNDQLCRLNPHKSMWLGGIYTRVLGRQW